jgi:predicted O-linked N-acetylglucosamine transferase (SPINDLY family)
VAAERLIFAPRTTVEEHLPRQRAADLFLDTLPCNAHTTASDALRVGLPVLTCTGTSFASRVAASLLTAQGLTELVTPNLTQYESMALSLAQNPAKLTALRNRAVEAISGGQLLNTPALASHLERAYAQIHEWAEAGMAPQHLDIGPLTP